MLCQNSPARDPRNEESDEDSSSGDGDRGPAGGRRALAASRDGSAGPPGGAACLAAARRRAAGAVRIPCAGLPGAPAGRLRGSGRVRPTARRYPAPAGPAPGYPPAASYAPSGDPAPSVPPPAYQPPYAYPQRGQNPQQATTDQSECGAWASQQTGFDPNAPVGSSSQAGAAGASSPSGVFGGIQRREERRDFRRQQLAGQSAAGFQQDGYMRALNACLTARGYTVR